MLQEQTAIRKKRVSLISPETARYRRSLIQFAEAQQWDLFGTIGIGACSEDDEVMRRLRLIEAKLNKTFVRRDYHKLRDGQRFSIWLAFEGERDCGDRHCHFLLTVPIPKNSELSHDALLDKLPLWLNILWDDLSAKPWSKTYDDPINPKLHVGLCGERGPSYVFKQVSNKDDDRLEWQFITPPKFMRFENDNLSDIRNRDRQKRQTLR